MKNKVLFYQLACIVLLVIMIIMLLNRNPGEDKNVTPKDLKKEATIAVIQNRKSVRNYISGKQISREDIEDILRSGMAAPSGKDLRPWEIMVVDNRELLDSLAGKLPYAKMLKNAPLAIIVCGNKEVSSYWYLDCSAVSQNILLAVEALELGAVWTAVYPYDDRINAVLEVIDLPENVIPLNVIPIGYPEGKQNVKEKFNPGKVHYNEWNRSDLFNVN